MLLNPSAHSPTTFYQVLKKRSLKHKLSSPFLNKHPRDQWPGKISISFINKLTTILQKQHSKEARPRPNNHQRHQQHIRRATARLSSAKIYDISEYNTLKQLAGEIKQQPSRSQSATILKSKSIQTKVQEEKIVRLLDEKEKLLEFIFANTKGNAEEVDQDGSQMHANSLNFKAYHCLNKLMEIKEQLEETVGPKLKKKRMLTAKVTNSNLLYDQ